MVDAPLARFKKLGGRHVCGVVAPGRLAGMQPVVLLFPVEAGGGDAKGWTRNLCGRVGWISRPRCCARIW